LISTSTFGVIDLTFFWFPQPFGAHLERQLEIKSVRVAGCALYFDLDYIDVNMYWVYTAGLNFFTFKLYAKFVGKKSYFAWLDSNLSFVGAPPLCQETRPDKIKWTESQTKFFSIIKNNRKVF
jgi:hypothetical protein